MKIMQIITRSELGGAQSVVINLSNYLSAKHEVILVAGGNGKMWEFINHDIIKEPIRCLKRPISPFSDLAVLFHLLRLRRKYRPDIVHLHSSKIGILGRIVFPKAKIVYTVHGFDSIRLAHRFFLPIERLLQKRCRYIVGVSLYDELNLKKENIKTNVKCIYNGIYAHQNDGEIIGRLDNGKKSVLSIARLEYPKRFDVFIETAKLLPQYNFIWIGNLCEINHVPNNVFCLGNIPNAARYNSICDLFMLASDFEGLPIVILEAMSYGKPIVASDVGGVKEIILNDINGFVVENSSLAFAQKITDILNDNDLYLKLSANSLRVFRENFTVEKMVEKYMNLFLN